MTPDEASQLKALQQHVAFLSRQLQAAEKRLEKKTQQVELKKQQIERLKGAVDKEKAATARERAAKEKAIACVKELRAALAMGKALGPEILDITARCLEAIFGPDAQADIPQAQKDQIGDIVRKHRAEFENLTQFRVFFRFFDKGSESLRKRSSKRRKGLNTPKVTAAEQASATEQDEASLENKTKPFARDVDSRMRSMTRIIGANGAAAKQAAQDGGDAVTQACAAIADTTQPPETEDAVKPSQGRQTVAGFQRLETPEVAPPEHCPHCHGGNVVTGAEQVRNLRNLVQGLNNLIGFANGAEQYNFCRDCGEAFVTIPEHNVPCSPQNTFSQEAVISLGVINMAGVPLKKLTDLMFDKTDQVGHESIGRSVHEWALSFGAPLSERMRQRLAHCPVLMMDETPLAVLQSRGQGVCEPAEVHRQTDYIVIQTTPDDSDGPRISLFRYIGGRSNEAIAAALADMSPEVLVSDGYASYASYCKTSASLAQHACLAHLRRVLLDALNIKEMEKVFFPEKKYDEEQVNRAVALMRERHKDKSFAMLFCSVIEAFSKIYAFEKTVRRQPSESYEEHLRKVLECRQKYAKPLMEHVDTIMVSLAEQLCTSNSDGTDYEAKDKNSLYAKATTYYMNRREQFRVFLSDPRVPPDNNAAERAIRPVAVLRKAINFKQSQSYTNSMCTWLSLVETAKANGVRDVVGWLSEYGRALYKYRMDAALNRRIKSIREDGQGNEQQRMEDALNKRILTPEYNKVSLEGFPFDDWMPWNYAKRLAQAAKPQA